MKHCWKIFCDELEHPGLWRKWWEEQCVAVGFAPQRGYRLHEKSDNSGWNRARSCLKQIKAGDEVVVQLAKHRVARVGEVLEPKIEDDQWEPTYVTDGFEEYGRRIRVNWRLNLGPSDPDVVVNLPEPARISGGIRLTIAKLSDDTFNAIAEAIRDGGNWASMFSYFPYERALSEYVAQFPQRIEGGLTPYPDAKKLTERVLAGC